MSGNFLTIPGDDPIQKRSRVIPNQYVRGADVEDGLRCLHRLIAALVHLDIKYANNAPAARAITLFNDMLAHHPELDIFYDKSSSLTDLISAFDTTAQAHTDRQKVTAFSGTFDKNYKPTFSREEYGKPIPGSMTEHRGAEAQARVCTEMKELCEIINDYGKPPCKSLLPPEMQCATKVISFGELFTIYTVINDKLVGLLLRTRKHQLTYFEGEVLFQKRDDDVPIFLIQPISEIRTYCTNKAIQARRSVSPMPS